jgi:hypothetical protein
MAWFVQALQKRTDDGKPAGIWHLCASSDEGGGFYPGCDHDHHSPEEAEACRDAKVAVGAVTGFPYEPKKIKVNGVEHELDGRLVSHEQICDLAKQPAYASVTYEGLRHDDVQRSGIMYPGKMVKLEDGMIFDCVATGSA